MHSNVQTKEFNDWIYIFTDFTYLIVYGVFVRVVKNLTIVCILKSNVDG